MPKPLCQAEWFNNDPIYRRVFEILNIGATLPDPCSITILPPTPPPQEAKPTTYGLCWVRERVIWFREQPPGYDDFAHELIHLIPGKDATREEVYAYNLSQFVAELARRGIKPPVNPVKLLDIRDTSVVLNAIREVYNYGFRDLADYFQFLGVIPVFLEPVADAGGFRLVPRPGYSEDLVAVEVVSELAVGSIFDELQFRVLLRLLDSLTPVGSRN
jgi:hypothetical protein